MRINDFINAQLAPVQAFTRPPTFVPLRYLNGALTVRGASGDQSDSRARQQADQTSATSGNRRGRLTSAKTSRGGDSVELGGQQALLEQYVRKHAAVSFSVPNAAGGTTNFAFEVETAYRLITPVEPGILVDEEG